jgi:hypothetical protein
MSVKCRLCCKSLKTRGDKFPARTDLCRGCVAVSSWVNCPLLPVVLFLPQGFAAVATMNK